LIWQKNMLLKKRFFHPFHSKETLGFDRLAAAVGAHTTFPDSNVLIIDAGTAITIDMVTAKGEFLGGNISPGLEMRFKALNTFTKKCPSLKKGLPGLPGKQQKKL
jgi:type III pantothenate kinase